MILARKNIQNATPYIAGKPIDETKRELGLKEVIKLASNENPLGTSPAAVQAIKKAASTVNRYPDSNGFYLKKKLASKLKLSPENIVLGNGSDELIDIIIKTFVEEDENIVTANITFVEYEIIAKAYNRRVKIVPLKDFRFDLEAIQKAIDNKTKLVFIANPNNPTGTYVNKSELERFLKKLPQKLILVLDEAYDTFIDVADYPQGMDYLKNNNIIVLKTFSKAYGLAGLRIGFSVADTRFSAYMEKARQPFNVNLIAQEASLAALDDSAFLKRTRKAVLDGKKYIYAQLCKLNIKYIPSVANFVLFDVGKDCQAVFKEMLKLGVIVRDMKQYGLDNFIRVTIGTASENKKFVAALKKVL
jgi:histidinol-phosphate aminotransferase